jgi:hypothetical protein
MLEGLGQLKPFSFSSSGNARSSRVLLREAKTRAPAPALFWFILRRYRFLRKSTWFVAQKRAVFDITSCSASLRVHMHVLLHDI